MSMNYYARKKEPRVVYDEYEIGYTSNGEFNKVWADINEMYFKDIGDLIEFVEKTDRYTFMNECGEEVSKDRMLKIIAELIVEEKKE